MLETSTFYPSQQVFYLLNELMKTEAFAATVRFALLYLHLILGLVQAVGQSCSSGLIDHTQDIQTSDLTSVFSGLKNQRNPSQN